MTTGQSKKVKESSRIFVYVSALTFLSAPLHLARAAPTINCTQGISFGTILPQCNGSITVKGTNSSGTTNNGCHSLISGAIRPATCTAMTTLGTATMNARITFSTTQAQFSNTMGAGLATLDNYRLQTAGGSQLNSHTYNAALLNPSHSFKVGGRLRFNGAEPIGTYNGSVIITVTSIP